MTVRFGMGDRHLPSFPPGQRSSSPLLGDEPTFLAREYFVDVFEEEAHKAYEDFQQRIEPVLREVFEIAWPDPPELDGETKTRLEYLLERRGISWKWPSGDPGSTPFSETSAYSEAFEGWPAPAPKEVWDRFTRNLSRTLHEAKKGKSDLTPHGKVAFEKRASRYFQEPSHWEECWRLLGWLLPAVLDADLDSWCEKWNLEENEWVASHLLARTCKARLLGEEKARLDHVVFGSPGVLARFKESLDGSFGSFRDWDPTQERWGEWRKAADDLFRRTLKSYNTLIVEKSKDCKAPLTATPAKVEADRDFLDLVQFQVFRKTLQSLVRRGSDVKSVQKAIHRTADLVGLTLRTESPSSG